VGNGREHRFVALKFMKNRSEFETEQKFHKDQIASIVPVEKFIDSDEESAEGK